MFSILSIYRKKKLQSDISKENLWSIKNENGGNKKGITWSKEKKNPIK